MGDIIVVDDTRRKRRGRAIVSSVLRRGGWVIVSYGIRHDRMDFTFGEKRFSARALIELYRRPWPHEQNGVEMLDLVQTHMEAALGIGDELGPIPQDEGTYAKIEGVFEMSRQYLLGAPPGAEIDMPDTEAAE
jgi:hypothetical protein